jgi:hypothetical protein
MARRPDDSGNPMRDARKVLEELVRHVQPPKGCAIVLTERPISSDSEPNWMATVGPMGVGHARRFTQKVAELRKTDPRMDWSALTKLDGRRRTALRLSELIAEPV